MIHIYNNLTKSTVNNYIYVSLNYCMVYILEKKFYENYMFEHITFYFWIQLNVDCIVVIHYTRIFKKKMFFVVTIILLT